VIIGDSIAYAFRETSW